MKVKYTGELPCVTVDPPADWQPGEVKELDTLVNNPLFIVIDAVDSDVVTKEPDDGIRR